jgi:hypothetical protein
MRTLLSIWKFHKAGQGCFYSGLINAHGQDMFSFVFDCGSNNGSAILREEISKYKEDLKKKGKNDIDLLVISHYDADHINQLPLLLKDLNCKIAVLPYLTTLERLDIYFGQTLNDSTVDDDYRNFIRDPAGYLTGLGINEIIFFNGNDENVELGNPLEPADGPLNDNSIEEIKRSRQAEQEHVSLTGNTGELNFISATEVLEKESLMSFTSNVRVAKGNGRIRSGFYWQFYFYNKKRHPERIEAFKNHLRKMFGVCIEEGLVTNDELTIIFGTQKARSKMKKAHIDFFGDINRTGLITLHGPLKQRHTECYNKKSFYSGKHCFTLLNGDCDLSDINYPVYVDQALPSTKIFQVPHHGSRLNWTYAGELARLEMSHHVINHATTAKHPHPYVVAQIKSNYPIWKLKHNTELKSFTYHITSYI